MIFTTDSLLWARTRNDTVNPFFKASFEEQCRLSLLGTERSYYYGFVLRQIKDIDDFFAY